MEKTPKLRFPEFSGEWEEKRLEELGKFFKGALLSKADLSNEGKPCILYGELYTKYNEVIKEVYSKTNSNSNNLVVGKKNDVLIPSSGETAIDIATASCLQKDEVVLGGDLNVFRPYEVNGVFISYQLNNSKRKEIARIAQGASVVHIYNEQLKKLKINIPQKREQQKLSEFFSLIDEKIAKQQNKVEALEEYKKGMMQKIFSQEIRFKDTNGESYPDWEKKKLCEVLKERKTFSTKGLEYPHVTLSKDGIYDKGERYERDFLVKTEDKNYKITQLGDICYNPANLKFGVICINNYGNAIFSPIYVTFEVKKYFNNNYIAYFFMRRDFIDRVRKYEEGTVYERMAVKPEDFLKHETTFPCFKEQEKIGNFIQKIDDKIIKEQEKVDLLSKLKKGLLQQMFV